MKGFCSWREVKRGGEGRKGTWRSMQAFMKGVLIAWTMVEMTNGGRVEATMSLTSVFFFIISVPISSVSSVTRRKLRSHLTLRDRKWILWTKSSLRSLQMHHAKVILGHFSILLR